MSSDKIATFVNGIIAGAGAVLAFMSYGFLQYVSPLENIQGVTTTELRVAILLGGLVCAIAVGYEFYSKKDKPKKESKIQTQDEDPTKKTKEDKINETKDDIIAETKSDKSQDE